MSSQVIAAKLHTVETLNSRTFCTLMSENLCGAHIFTVHGPIRFTPGPALREVITLCLKQTEPLLHVE